MHLVHHGGGRLILDIGCWILINTRAENILSWKSCLQRDSPHVTVELLHESWALRIICREIHELTADLILTQPSSYHLIVPLLINEKCRCLRSCHQASSN